MKRLPLVVIIILIFAFSTAGQQNRGYMMKSHRTATTATAVAPAATTGVTYSLVAWTELGMHCIDGKDYSVFSVLPPYNVIHAQLIQKSEPPALITSGVTITYQATTDAKGSYNSYSSSSNKTNFWDYVQTLFLTNPPPETGLAGYKTQSATPQNMTYNATEGYWEAVGIPTVPYDDKLNFNAYPMAKIIAKDSKGNTLATSTVVLSVSDEISCSTCHASNSDVNA